MKALPAIAAAAALAVSGCALWLTTGALHELKAQSRLELSMSLQRQFDTDYKQDRADCARAFLYGDHHKGKKKVAVGLESSRYDLIMDFFDSLGYLVERGAVDEEMARRAFAYYLDNYFEATQKLLRRDQKKFPRRYQHVFALARRWHEDGPRPNLAEFFEDELAFAEPPPSEEGPRT